MGWPAVNITSPMSILLFVQIILLIIFPKKVTLADGNLDANDISSIFEPNLFLRESSCNSNIYDEQRKDGGSSNALSCNKYKITTLNSNPKRCLQINNNLPRKEDKDESKPSKCLDSDYPQHDWIDGTNGCYEYNRNPKWCELYGNISYKGKDANQVCCVCGGGNRIPLLFQVGDMVNFDFSSNVPLHLKSMATSSVCPLEVVQVHNNNKNNDSPYELKFVEDCIGTTFRDKFSQNILLRAGTHYMYPVIATALQPYVGIEIKKCRAGVPEQEFWVIPIATKNPNTGVPFEHDDEKQSVIIQHVLTNMTISSLSNSLTKASLSQKVELKRVFVEEQNKFDESDKYIYITKEEYQRGGKNELYLVSGSFGETDYSKPNWKNHESPYAMWSLERVSSYYDDNGSTTTIYDEHGEWLRNKVSRGNGGLDYLKQLAPWHLLDVERDASKHEVKSRFRELSRQFHPDKQRGGYIGKGHTKISPELLQQVFVLLQQAYDGLKTSNTRQKHSFQEQAEVESQLFAHSHAVVELLPSHWIPFTPTKKSARYNGKNWYILSTNEIISNTSAGGTNITCVESDEELCHKETLNTKEQEKEVKNFARIWLLFLYSPRCSMSRTVVSMVELAASHLKSYGIQVGAYGCGIYGDSLEKSKRKGFAAWQEDPICKQFQRIETPNTHVVIEPIINGDTDKKFAEKAAKFVNFYAAAAHGTIKDLYPRKLIDFAIYAKKSWENSFLVDYLTQDDLDDPTFHNVNRIIAYIDELSLETNYDVQQTVLTELPRLAARVKEANITVHIISCASGAEDENSTMVDCSQHSVSFLPDIKIFAINKTLGVSMIYHQLKDRRDAEIAIEVLGNSIAGLLGLGENEDYLNNEDDVNTEKSSNEDDSTCFDTVPQTNDEDFKKLDGEDALKHLPESANKKTPLPEKVDPKLTENPSKPKLADRPKTRTLNERKPERQQGSGKIIGGSNSQGGTKRIAG